MPVKVMRILIVGPCSMGTFEVLRRLAARGWGSRQVLTLREARDQLETFDFDVVLASEFVSDGRGYDIADSVARHRRTLLVGVALSESCLWLPVVERGAAVLGNRALNAQMFESEMGKLLVGRAREIVRAVSSPAAFAGSRAGPPRLATLPPAIETHRPAFMRRKYRDRDIVPA